MLVSCSHSDGITAWSKHLPRPPFAILFVQPFTLHFLPPCVLQNLWYCAFFSQPLTKHLLFFTLCFIQRSLPYPVLSDVQPVILHLLRWFTTLALFSTLTHDCPNASFTNWSIVTLLRLLFDSVDIVGTSTSTTLLPISDLWMVTGH